jgi:subtilisin family serine protease
VSPSPSRAAAVVAALALAACADDPAAPRTAVGVPPRVTLPDLPTDVDDGDGWLVLLRDGARDVAEQRSRAGSTIAYRLRSRAGFVVADGADVDAQRADPNVARVVRNTRVQKAGYPSTAALWRRGWQWNMRQVRADQVPSGLTGAGVRVCVVDGGVDPDHQDLAGKVVAAAAFPGTTTYQPEDDVDGHGTHVASTVTANGIGVEGVAPGALLLNANVFGPDVSTSVARVVDAMDWCVRHGADVVNLSLGSARTRGSTTWVSDSTTYTEAAARARAAGAVVVAAAGNAGRAIPSTAASGAALPAEATGIVAVGATGPAPTTAFPFSPAPPHPLYDQRAGYSNVNSGDDALGPGVRLYAPGGANSASRSPLNVTAACASSAGPNCASNGAYFSTAGTSMAAPHVAGVAALVTGRSTRSRGLARTEAVEACLLATADPLPAGPPFFGRGRLNAQRATTEPCPGL